MDFSTKEKVEKLISTVESQSDTLTSEELSTLLPITFPDMDTDNGSTTSDDIFKTIEIEALSENHRSEIDKMQNVLEQRSCESNDFKLALECIKLCKDGKLEVFSLFLFIWFTQWILLLTLNYREWLLYSFGILKE